MDNENLESNLRRVNDTINAFTAEAMQKINKLEDDLKALSERLELLEKNSGG